MATTQARPVLQGCINGDNTLQDHLAMGLPISNFQSLKFAEILNAIDEDLSVFDGLPSAGDTPAIVLLPELGMSLTMTLSSDRLVSFNAVF